ncbi:BESS domain-containing protein family protein [Loa loa]|nr:BESS domain-containing protein family protein [Loa loa]EJD75929.1 BESS domain-containing protein family protein [Loa loa]
MPTVQIQSAVGQHTGSTTTTLSTAIATGGTPLISTSILDEDFTRRLIEAVKAQPCLYNPNHEHYGNKHSSAQYRIQVWQKLRVELGFKDDAHALQMQWKRIRDRYVRERRKRRNVDSGENNQDSLITGRERHASGSSNCSSSSSAVNVNTSLSSQQFTEMMRWIEPFLVDNMSSLHSTSMGAVTSSSNVQRRQIQNLTSQQSNSSQEAPGGRMQPRLAAILKCRFDGAITMAALRQMNCMRQNGSSTLAVIAPTGVSNTGTYFVHCNLNVKQEASSQGTSIGPTEGVTVSSYQQTSQLQMVNTQVSCEYNTLPDHGLSNGSNGDRNTNAISTSATDNGSPCSSTASSEIDVGTSVAATSHSNQQQVVLQQRQRQSLSQHPSSMVVLTAIQSQQVASSQQQQQQPILLPKVEPRSKIGQQLQTADGGVVTVTARGVAPVAGVIKKDVNVRTNDGGTVTMIIDPTTFYQHGSQKMYRLVNVSELNTDAVSSNNGMSTVCGELKVVGVPQRRKRVAAVSVQGMSSGRGQLGDEVVLDDGISEKTVTIDQGTIPGNEKIVLDQRPTTAVAGGTNIVLGHSVQQQMHQQQAPNSSHSHPGISVSPQRATVLATSHAAQMGLQQTSSIPLRQQAGHRFVTQAVSVEHPHYAILPSQSLHEEHDANLAFANSIANYLSRLNEDEKAVAKMNIQRILMDARFGLGACARMIHDEELNEAAAAAVVSTASHDVVSTRQHGNGTSRRLNLP